MSRSLSYSSGEQGLPTLTVLTSIVRLSGVLWIIRADQFSVTAGEYHTADSDITHSRAGRQCQLITLSKRRHLCKRCDTDAARFEEHRMWCSISAFAPHAVTPGRPVFDFALCFECSDGVDSPYK